MNCEEKDNLIKAHLHRGCGCGRQHPCRESRRPLAPPPPPPPPPPSPDPPPMLAPLPMLDLHCVCPSLVSSWLPCSAAIPIWRGRPSWPRGTNRVSPPGSSIPKVLLICPNIPSFLLILKLISREPAMDWPGYHRLFLNFTWWQFVLVLCVLMWVFYFCRLHICFFTFICLPFHLLATR